MNTAKQQAISTKVSKVATNGEVFPERVFYRRRRGNGFVVEPRLARTRKQDIAEPGLAAIVENHIGARPRYDESDGCWHRLAECRAIDETGRKMRFELNGRPDMTNLI